MVTQNGKMTPAKNCLVLRCAYACKFFVMFDRSMCTYRYNDNNLHV